MTLEIRKNRYFSGFAVFMVVNIGLGAYLFGVALGQTDNLGPQKELSVDVLLQQNAPLNISVDYVSNSERGFQNVVYSVHNSSSRPIRGYVIVQKDSLGLGKRFISYLFPTLAPGKTIRESIAIERSNVKPDAKIFLAIDYVQFADGTKWGADVEKESERISGYVSGYQHAFSVMKRLSHQNDEIEILRLLTKDISTINPSMIHEDKSDLWQTGFNLGYRSIFSQLKSVLEQRGVAEISTKIAEIGKLNDAEKIK